MTQPKQVHIGELIKREFDKLPRSCTVTWFARYLHCDRTNIYDIFSRQSIDTALLMRISCILNHNFFDDYSRQFASTLSEWSNDDTPLPEKRTRKSIANEPSDGNANDKADDKANG